MKRLICVFVVISSIAYPVLAQELRKPTEVISFVVKSTYPAEIGVEVSSDSKFYVWYDYVGDRHAPRGFIAAKFELYEGTRCVKEITNYNGIPKRGVAMVITPQAQSLGRSRCRPAFGSDEYDNKITCTGWASVGFPKDEFIIGPFEYTVIRARPLGFDKSGFLYVWAEIDKENKKAAQGGYKWRRFSTIYKLNKEAKIIDSFFNAEAKYIESFGQASRYPWEWPDSMAVYMDNNGNVYDTFWPFAGKWKSNKIKIKRWRMK